MHIEKREPSTSKTYRETKHALESLEGARLELQGLHKRLENNIKELSSYLRNIKDSNVSKKAAEEMNRLKLHRKKIEEATNLIKDLDHTQWLEVKEEVQNTFAKAQNEIVTANSIMEK